MIFVLLCFLAGSLTAQEQFPDLKAYANAYVAQFGLTNVNWNRPPEMYETDPVENAKYATLRGNSQYLDTPFEIALYAYYSPKADAAPPAAEAILPHNNPRLVDRQLGAAVFQEIQILRFLGDTAAVNRHEAVLQFITGRGNATRAEIEAFYRNNVRALVSQVVDEEFNRVSFLLSNSDTFQIARSHDAILIRNPQAGYLTLSYGGAYTNNETRIITANSLDALLAEMGSRTSDFDQTGINQVRAQAALIPAVVCEEYNDTTPADVKRALTDFYIDPTRANYEYLLGIHRIHRVTSGNRVLEAIYASIRHTLTSLHPALAERVMREGR